MRLADGRRWLLALAGGLLAGVAPLHAEAERAWDQGSLAGTHSCHGRNPDGSAYAGTVRIRVKNGLVLMEWTIGERVSYGTGLVEGMGLGVGLENGVAVYQVVPQAEGKTLVGRWAPEGSRNFGEEVILIGDTDVTTAAFDDEKINGAYLALRENPKGGQDEADVTIAGKGAGKTLRGKAAFASGQSLLLGDAFAVITPLGLEVFAVRRDDKDGLYLSGHATDKSGAIAQVSLIPGE